MKLLRFNSSLVLTIYATKFSSKAFGWILGADERVNMHHFKDSKRNFFPGALFGLP